MKKIKGSYRKPYFLDSDPMNEPRTTMQDLADAAGVSKMTVSRILRGDRGASAKTREKVLQLAEEMSYRPDPAVTKLMNYLHKSKTAELEPLAWLTTYSTIGGWRNNHGTMEMYRGAVEQAKKLGYRLVEFSLNTPGMTPKRLSNILYNQSIRGIVLAPLYHYGNIEDFAWEHFVTACCGPSLREPRLNRVSIDQFVVLRTAWNHLRASGYNRIGLCVSANDNGRGGFRWEGSALVELQSVSSEERVNPMISDDWNAESFLRWYEKEQPDVVLSFPEVQKWMIAAGIRIPEDCGFALIRREQTEGIAGVDHRFYDLGATTVSLVASELNTNQYGIPRVRKTVSIECQWRWGPTVRKPLKNELAKLAEILD